MIEPKNQVTNLELSKELKELGYPQESLFYWITKNAPDYYLAYVIDDEIKNDEETLSAPTVAELLEVLSINDFYSTTHLTYTITEWQCDYRGYKIIEKRLPDALARMVILAKKDKFIELK